MMSPSVLAAEGAAAQFPILTALVVAPVLAALLIMVLPASRPQLVKQVAVLTSTTIAAMSIWLAYAFESGVADYQFVSRHPWIESMGVSWHIGVDGISLWLVVLTGILFPIAFLGADPHHDWKPYAAWLLVLEAGVMGSFLSLDLLLFFVFFEVVLVPMYFLIGGWGYDQRVYASMKFFLYTMFGSAFLFVGILATAFLARPEGGVLSFSITDLQANLDLSQSAGRWLFLAFAIAFAVKVPVFPLHTWLPDAHTQAPTAGSVILAGVMLKLGTYGLVRFAIGLFPEAARYFGPLMVTLGVIGIIYGAICAAMQKDLKRLVAYSSVAHLGFIVLGSFALTNQSLSGSVLQMVSHGISTPALFLMVGMISERRHTREIAALKGIQKAAPIFAACFMLVMLSSIGVPGLNGFVGEFLILIGSFLTFRWWTVVAATGVILSAVYLLWAYQRVFHGEPDEANKDFKELTWSEGLVMLPLLVIIVVSGLYPKPMLDRIQPSVQQLIARVEANTDYVEPKPVVPVLAEGESEEGEGALSAVPASEGGK
jgi:NADH-quinone oxidoreductase subunit M